MENIEMRTDEQLVALFAQGANEAFDMLLQRYKNKLYSYIFYVVKNADMTEDIFQETFVKAIMTIKQGKYTENGKFSAWITRIAHNLIVDQFRVEKNENTVSNDETEVDLFDQYSMADDSIESQLVEEQNLTDVKRLMKLLPDNQREVVYMRFYQDLSFKEIAEMTGVSINTALGRMRYALMNMRKMAEDSRLFSNY